MPRQSKFSAELKERAVRMVKELQTQSGSEWSAIESVSAKLGCNSETLRRWVRDKDSTGQVGPAAPSEEQKRIKDLEKEVKELRMANEILRKASAYFAQAELDRRFH